MEKRRMYFFDGKNITGNSISGQDNSKKFDQNFDDIKAGDVFKYSQEFETKRNNYNQQDAHFNNTQSNNVSYSNLNNFMMSGEYQSNYKMDENFRSQSPINNDSILDKSNFHKNVQGNLLSEAFISSIKDQYYKTKGYIENKPDTLMEFINEYKAFDKKGYKIPSKIQPFLSFSNDDIEYSLKFYYNQMANQIKSPKDSVCINKFKTKWTNESLKRLYPKLKTDEEVQRLKAAENSPELFEKFAKKLIKMFFNTNKELTNDEHKLFNFWMGLSQEDKIKSSLEWSKGENNLETNLNKYFSDEQIIERLSKIFQNVCGYECYHPRPLHDYWIKQIPINKRYFKGIAKYESEEFYTKLEEHYELRKKLEKELTTTKLNEKKPVSNKKRVSKEEYNKIIKKLDVLAKPKDKWRTGRAMLSLKKQFQYDNIIQKMIKYEFETNRVFKFPEEYALYDHETSRKILFKNSLEKNIKKENIETIKSLIQKTKNIDENVKLSNEKKYQDIIKEDMALERFLKNMCIKYYKLAEKRLSDKNKKTINHHLTDLYVSMLKYHGKATKRRFPKMKEYGKVKKSRFSNYPKGLKVYFYNLYKRLGINSEGKFVFANYDNMSFWGPSLSNKCKVHSSNCPLYCKNNTHNDVISLQRTKNFNVLFNLEENKLEDDERLNLWKRKEDDLTNLKSKIFLCLNEAEHCTFEPKINKKEENHLNSEEIINKRISNKVWVNKMGENFSERFPLVYKEGVYKKVLKPFNEGKYTEVLKDLEEAFDLDAIKAHFDKKFEIIYKKRIEEENKKRIKDEEEGKVVNNDLNNIKALLNQQVTGEKKKVPERDNFNNPKNLQICREIFHMLKTIESYRMSRSKTAKLIKEELKIIEEVKKEKSGKGVKNKIVKSTNLNATEVNTNNLASTNITDKNNENNNNTDTVNNTNIISSIASKPVSAHTLQLTNAIKDKYFKFFKTIMCPLKKECPFDIGPRWPHSDLKANSQFGQKCPYAHHISELKFEQEINEKIKIKREYLKELEKEDDPVIYAEWVPTGPIVSCTGCGKTYSDKHKGKGGSVRVGAAGGPKGLCGFCRYNQKNEIELKNDKAQAEVANKQILKNINYGLKKAEDWDQEYVAKFGMLKKSAVLYSFRRFVDSMKIMEKLKVMIESEQKENEEKFISLDKKWKTKLQILEHNIPKEILNYEISQEVLDHFKITVPLSTLLVYCEKIKKGNSFSIYNRHTYLNSQIMQFYQTVKKTLDGFKVDVKALKGQLDELTLWGNKKEKLKSENPKVFQKYVTKYKAQMCPNIVSGKKCPESFRNCKFAHNSNQLNLTLVQTTKKLMKNVIKQTENKMIKTTTTVPWSYPKQNVYEQGLKFDKELIKNYTESKLRSKSAKRTKSVDLRKMRLSYHEI